jgi:hypothetical protein
LSSFLVVAFSSEPQYEFGISSRPRFAVAVINVLALVCCAGLPLATYAAVTVAIARAEELERDTTGR